MRKFAERSLEEQKRYLKEAREIISNILGRFKIEPPQPLLNENSTIEELEQSLSELLMDCKPEVRKTLESLRRVLRNQISGRRLDPYHLKSRP